MTSTINSLALAGDEAPEAPLARRQVVDKPTMCKGIFGLVKHDWLYLPPSEEQYAEARELLSYGKGAYGRLHAKREDVWDRVCRKCLTPEARMSMFLSALRTARGLEDHMGERR